MKTRGVFQSRLDESIPEGVAFKLSYFEINVILMYIALAFASKLMFHDEMHRELKRGSSTG